MILLLVMVIIILLILMCNSSNEIMCVCNVYVKWLILIRKCVCMY